MKFVAFAGLVLALLVAVSRSVAAAAILPACYGTQQTHANNAGLLYGGTCLLMAVAGALSATSVLVQSNTHTATSPRTFSWSWTIYPTFSTRVSWIMLGLVEALLVTAACLGSPETETSGPSVAPPAPLMVASTGTHAGIRRRLHQYLCHWELVASLGGSCLLVILVVYLGVGTRSCKSFIQRSESHLIYMLAKELEKSRQRAAKKRGKQATQKGESNGDRESSGVADDEEGTGNLDKDLVRQRKLKREEREKEKRLKVRLCDS